MVKYVLIPESEISETIEKIVSRFSGAPFWVDAVREACKNVLHPTEVPESAVELRDQLQSGRHRNIVNEKGELLGHDFVFDLTADKAAALIDAYAKRVPRAMLEDIIRSATEVATDPMARALGECVNYQCIAAKHGYKVEG